MANETLSSYLFKVFHDNYSYAEPATNQAIDTYYAKAIVPVSGSGGQNYAINLSNLFPATASPAVPSVLTIIDDSPAPGIGFWIRPLSGGTANTGFQIRPNSLISIGISSVLTNIYVDNISATLSLYLKLILTA